MIIQLPRDTNSIVLQFDGSNFDRLDPHPTITLLCGSEPAPAAATSTPRRLTLPPLGVRRRTMVACGVAGMLVAGFGVSLLQSPRAEPALFQPRTTAWNDAPPGMPQQMPERMRVELEHGPTVMPPDAGPTPAPGPLAAPLPHNPFGLE